MNIARSQSLCSGGREGARYFDPGLNYDGCGVGFLARLDGEPSHALVSDGLRALVNLEHRGALGGDRTTGDGAGLMTGIPEGLFREILQEEGIEFPPPGRHGVGMVFLPRDEGLAASARQLLERAARGRGARVLGWRKVPVNPEGVGELAARSRPAIEQIFLDRAGIEEEAWERELYLVRCLAEREALVRLPEAAAGGFYVCSLSSRVLVYKGMLTAGQLAPFFPDLRDENFKSSFAVFHQRYSTNTLPSWPLAQPFRLLAHNGEINTLRGNINRMRGREAILKSALLGETLREILPVIDEKGSDSAVFDNVLELLVRAGRPLPQAVMMMIPEAWGSKFHMSEDKRAFYEYYSAVMEPWDGPAALVFCDGRFLGATVDRNGLRPARFTITREGVVVLASETGVLDFPPEEISRRGRLQPGKTLMIDLAQKRIVPDNEVKAKIARRRPYRRWVKDNRIELRGLFTPAPVPAEDPRQLFRLQQVFGYTEEELKMLLAPMASHGQEPVGSMGDDAALAVLSDRSRPLFAYFKQLFAQVTNPPIDPLREELVMSLMSWLGRESNLLDETPGHCRLLKLFHPLLTPEDMVRLRRARHPGVMTADLELLFPADGGGRGLEAALDELFLRAEREIAAGATVLILTDRGVDSERAAIPALLASSGLHHHLIRRGLRTRAGVIVETGEAREVAHFALLVGYGANAVCPYLALSAIRQLAETGLLESKLSPEAAMDAYLTAVKKGLLKTFSRMGVSTIRSYFGSQLFEAVGLGEEVVERYFTGTASRVGGIGLQEIAADASARHARGFSPRREEEDRLDVGGEYRYRLKGERHLWTPEVIMALQRAVREDDYELFKEYCRLIDDRAPAGVTLRSLFTFLPGTPVPLEEVEAEEKIVPRFVSSAMSFGSISREVHETIAAAFNRLGARSNSGEGGEDRSRFRAGPKEESLSSRVKQVASGRFGVTAEYLVNAEEIQIKMAQGAKPGEGGQLPGHKVTEEIARVRHTTAGVTLISPPPHHDIYSIEDLAQLIHDLRSVNPAARVSVKLVSEVGVGTVAAGVAKAGAEAVVISGHDGGTGASPLTSIKHVGLPWELGLAETQHALLRNRLRPRVRIQVDGQLRTGRDLAIAALLGAEEFGFGTVVLVSLGCVMARKCHLNTCPVGIATQDERLRRLFLGRPEHARRLFIFLARNLRERMTELGFRTVQEMVGAVERLGVKPSPGARADKLDLGPLLSPPADPPSARRSRPAPPAEYPRLDDRIIALARPALERKEAVRIELKVRNIHRGVGARLSGEIARRFGAEGLPGPPIELILKGTGGQSLGAFLAPGVSLRLEGDTNDYLGKGMSGGRIVVVPPEGAGFVSHENVIAGNTALYGATGGEVFIGGIAGERFAVRNSGASAVVEGVGDHGCEYMTGGVVVILGPTGNNFAAGMSGGVAYVYDESELFDTRCNLDMVDLESVWKDEDGHLLRLFLEKHQRFTGSGRAEEILKNWEAARALFVKVMPIDYRRSLARMRLAEDLDREVVAATEEVFTEAVPF